MTRASFAATLKSAMRAIHVGNSVFYRGGARTPSEWRAAVAELLDHKRTFLAWDLAKMGLDCFPRDLGLTQVAARALTQAGALDEARALLEPLCGSGRLDRALLDEIARALRGSLAADEATESLEKLVEQLARAVRRVEVPAATDEETLGLLARVFKGLWQEGNADQLPPARDAYLRAYDVTGGAWTGINAATLSWILGAHTGAPREHELAQALAERVRNDLLAQGADQGSSYWDLATLGEAHLLLGRADDAVASFEAAVSRGRGEPGMLDSSRRQLALLVEAGFEVPGALLGGDGDRRGLLDPPGVVVFAGHMADPPGAERARFPEEANDPVRRLLDELLDELDAQVGYSSAASGADILFIEAMHARGGEVNVVLPFRERDFVESSVKPAGRAWERRFQRALRIAADIRCVTEEVFDEGGDALFEFGASVTHGLARLRAELLGTEPHLIAVWDGTDAGGPGGTVTSIRQWQDRDRGHVVSIADPESPRVEGLEAVDIPRAAPPARAAGNARVIKSLMFADIVGYSKLAEADAPNYVHTFLSRVAAALRDVGEPDKALNTWGDAIFVVMNRTRPMVDYAMALVECVHRTNWADEGLSSDVDVRVALHAGPVFRQDDPLTLRPNFYGSHVNRAARIEPITRPGCVYASEQFVGLLAHQDPTALDREVSARYVGTVPLAKNFGEQRLYHLRKR